MVSSFPTEVGVRPGGGTCCVDLVDPSTTRSDTYRAAKALVTFLGLYQGAVPLVVRGLFDRDQRFAPTMWLPSPWWWVACLAVVAVTVTLLAVLDDARPRRLRSDADPSQPATSTPGARDADRDTEGASGYDALSGAVFLVGIYNGVAPFVARLLLDGDLLLALPLRLPAPWWWITSLVVIVATFVLLALIDVAKQRRHADD